MDESKLAPAPLAYQNEPFLNSPDGRILRILAEYSEPVARFRREQIQDTVVFFGSARFHGLSTAKKALAELERTGSVADPDIEYSQTANHAPDKTTADELAEPRIGQQQVVMCPFRPPRQDDQKHSHAGTHKNKH